MSLRFPFQHPPSGGESECKNTTIFQSTKIFFRFFLFFFESALNDSYLFEDFFLIIFVQSHSGSTKTLSTMSEKHQNGTKNGKNDKKQHLSLDYKLLDAISDKNGSTYQQ